MKKSNLLFGLAVVFLFFFLADKIPLWSSDEGRHAEIAREMWESKDFILPHFNYVRYLEKPVMSFFLVALSFGAFGVNSLSARLPSILPALMGILATFIFTRRLFDRKTADLSAVILSTSVGYVLMGRFAMLDMLMTFLFSSAMLCLMIAVTQNKPKFYFAAYFFMGLSVLTKGLMGVLLPALIFLCFLIWTKNLKEIPRMRLGWGVFIVSLIVLPWTLAVSRREPDFFNIFIFKHHFERFASTAFGRKRPFWFFVPILFGLSLPWSIFLPKAVRQGLKTEDPEKKTRMKFLISWIAVVFVFFSLPKSKLPHYLLPICVPLAMLLAVYLSEWMQQMHKRKRTIAALAACTYLSLIALVMGMWGVSPRLSTFNEAQVLKRILKEGDHVAVYATLDHFSDFPFYLRRRVIVAGSDRGTLATGSEKNLSPEESKKWFMNSQEFAAFFNSGKNRVYVLVEDERTEYLKMVGLTEYQIIHHANGKLLITNRVP